MAGHSHWKQIKHEKGATDVKRAALFSKLLRAITAAARTETDPGFNPTLRTAIEKARAANIPRTTIEHAITRRDRDEESLETLTLEAYGPEGVALLIEAISDNKNRTVMEMKNLLKDHGAKWAEPGSVQWAFFAEGGEPKWHPKFFHPLSPSARASLATLVEALKNRDDIRNVTTNAAIEP